MKIHKKGFTLIELLIVIALLGALAVGLLAALDPFEQLKKGNDTGVRNTVSELHGAAIRYYSIKNQLPWGTSTVGPSNVSTGFSTVFNIQAVIDSGELKSDFSALAGGQLASITMMGASEALTVCFKPASKAFRSDPNTKYNTSFTDTGTNNVSNCGSPSAANFSCYWCVR